MAKYRKKPVVIEAVKWGGHMFEHKGELPLWLGEAISKPVGTLGNIVREGMTDTNQDTLSIFTMEGKMTASAGDYIIRGIAGELYPCKPTIFERTYEEVVE